MLLEGMKPLIRSLQPQRIDRWLRKIIIIHIDEHSFENALNLRKIASNCSWAFLS